LKIILEIDMNVIDLDLSRMKIIGLMKIHAEQVVQEGPGGDNIVPPL
jgi:hypothetical protein